MKQTALELSFFESWCRLHGPPLEEEFRFNAPHTRHRLDFAHLQTRTAIEIEGGTFIRGRHNRGPGYNLDLKKYNLVAALGWHLFRLDTKMVKEDSHYIQIMRFIHKAEVYAMADRVLTGIDVLVYKPLVTKIKETGYVRAAYPLALLSVAGCFYLIDPFGIGSSNLNTGGWYNHPVYVVPDSESDINYRGQIVGIFPVVKEYLNLLTTDRTVDLADFIEFTPTAEYRLNRWVDFVRQERDRVAS